MEISPPALMWTVAEPFRAACEFVALFASSPALMMAPRGDGHTVLVLPGFAANDLSTLWLRSYLDFLGYRSVVWGLGLNAGYQTLGKAESKLRRRVRDAARQSGQKISLVGWSLGGVMARHMARVHPEHIRRVVTLGAPFTGDPSATSIRGFYEWLSGEDFASPDTQAAWNANRAAPAVPTASIYTKTDGITAWQNCIEIETDLSVNLEIVGSHMGLPHNPMALRIVADQLARSDGNSAGLVKHDS